MPLQVIKCKAPFVTWGMDFVGPLPQTPCGNQYLATAIDYSTGWAYTQTLTAHLGMAAVRLVKTIIENHGFPHSITTDNGSKFNSNIFENFLSGHKIKHNHISSYHPQSNGLVKRFHGTLIGGLRKMCGPDKQAEWDLYLPLAVFGYRTLKTAGLERSPFYMCYGVEPTVAVTHQKDRTKSRNQQSPKFNQERKAQIAKINEKAIIRLAKHEQQYFERALTPGKLVLRQLEMRPSKLHPQWDGPFVIHSVNPNGSYRLKTPNGTVLKYSTNGDHLKRFFGNNSNLHFNQNIHKGTGRLMGKNEVNRQAQGQHALP
jgi:hypothetical protein